MQPLVYVRIYLFYGYTVSVPIRVFYIIRTSNCVFACQHVPVSAWNYYKKTSLTGVTGSVYKLTKQHKTLDWMSCCRENRKTDKRQTDRQRFLHLLVGLMVVCMIFCFHLIHSSKIVYFCPNHHQNSVFGMRRLIIDRLFKMKHGTYTKCSI